MNVGKLLLPLLDFFARFLIAMVTVGYYWLQIDFGKDFEQQLSFYVEVRASFSNLDAVLIYLVQVSDHLDNKGLIDMWCAFIRMLTYWL